MNRRTWWFCRLVTQLDWIPRYGRLYRLERVPTTSEADPNWKSAAAEWRWQKRGHWGLNLLSKLNLLWPFLDEYQRRYGVTDATSE